MPSSTGTPEPCLWHAEQPGSEHAALSGSSCRGERAADARLSSTVSNGFGIDYGENAAEELLTGQGGKNASKWAIVAATAVVNAVLNEG